MLSFAASSWSWLLFLLQCKHLVTPVFPPVTSSPLSPEGLKEGGGQSWWAHTAFLLAANWVLLNSQYIKILSLYIGTLHLLFYWINRTFISSRYVQDQDRHPTSLWLLQHSWPQLHHGCVLHSQGISRVEIFLSVCWGFVSLPITYIHTPQPGIRFGFIPALIMYLFFFLLFFCFSSDVTRREKLCVLLLQSFYSW